MRSEQQVFDDLAALCAAPGFIHAVAWLCVRDNLIAYAGDLKPDDLRHLYTKNRVMRSEMITLLGLIARTDIDYSFVAPEVHKGYCDQAEALLAELHEAMVAPWIDEVKALISGTTIDPANPVTLDFHGSNLREPIFYGGESAYSFQYRDLAPLKYQADRDWLLANKGFDIDIARMVAKAILEHHNRISIESAAASQLAKSYQPLLAGFEFTVEDIVAQSGLDGDVVQRVIEAFTLPTGERNAAFRTLSDYNAISAMPIFRRDDRYVLLGYFNLVSALYETPIYWMTADKAYKATAFKNRGEYAEKFAFDRLVAVFGPESVFQNVHIPGKKGETMAEIDVLVFFAGLAIVVQAKTRRLSIEARKGNDQKIQEDFQEAVQNAYDQAFDCADLILKPETSLLGADQRPITLPYPVTRVFPICLVADHYPALALQADEFLKVRSHTDLDPPVVIDVFALDAIAEMLDTPLRLLSYLQLRGRFGHKLHVSHEMTLLSVHILRNLWVDAQYDYVHFEDDLTIDLEIALMVRREGIPGKRTPEGVLTKFANSLVGRLLSALESNPQPRMVDLGLLLLELSEPMTSSVNLSIDKLVRETNKLRKGHRSTLVLGEASTGMTLSCAPEWNQRAAMDFRALCEIRKYESKASTWYGLVFDPGGDVRVCLKLENQWEHDENMDKAVASMHGIKPETGAALNRRLAKEARVGRNDPCPCKSGRKYKQCCLKH